MCGLLEDRQYKPFEFLQAVFLLSLVRERRVPLKMAVEGMDLLARNVSSSILNTTLSVHSSSSAAANGKAAFWWGAPDSTIDFCELNYSVVPFIAEFYNTLSHFPTAIVTIWIMYLMFQRRQKRREKDENEEKKKKNDKKTQEEYVCLLPSKKAENSVDQTSPTSSWKICLVEARYFTTYIMVIVVCVGSILFHGTMRRWGQVLDEVPMMLYCTTLLYSFFYRSSLTHPENKNEAADHDEEKDQHKSKKNNNSCSSENVSSSCYSYNTKLFLGLFAFTIFQLYLYFVIRQFAVFFIFFAATAALNIFTGYRRIMQLSSSSSSSGDPSSTFLGGGDKNLSSKIEKGEEGKLNSSPSSSSSSRKKFCTLMIKKSVIVLALSLVIWILERMLCPHEHWTVCSNEFLSKRVEEIHQWQEGGMTSSTSEGLSKNDLFSSWWFSLQNAWWGVVLPFLCSPVPFFHAIWHFGSWYAGYTFALFCHVVTGGDVEFLQEDNTKKKNEKKWRSTDEEEDFQKERGETPRGGRSSNFDTGMERYDDHRGEVATEYVWGVLEVV